MSRRGKISRSSSRKSFSHNARKVHKRNIPRSVMRGGIRL